MKTTIEQRKEKAVELMKELQIYKPYINDFKKDNLVTYFEHHIGYWAFQDEELNKILESYQNKKHLTADEIRNKNLLRTYMEQKKALSQLDTIGAETAAKKKADEEGFKRYYDLHKDD